MIFRTTVMADNSLRRRRRPVAFYSVPAAATAVVIIIIFLLPRHAPTAAGRPPAVARGRVKPWRRREVR